MLLLSRPGHPVAKSLEGKCEGGCGAHGDSAEMLPSADFWPRGSDLSTPLRRENTQIPFSSQSPEEREASQGQDGKGH